ncbi:MAG: 3'-5' exonuclease [Owenweeksia sp.]|nr:3'-5' exonuclease [Owenweeksia sp.]
MHLQSLPDKMYYLVNALELDIQTNPFLHALMDYVQDFQQQEGEDLAGFMRWWEEKGHTKNIALPETANALQVMTIHRCKGLRFNICILAFANWQINTEPGGSNCWLDLRNTETSPLPAALVSLSDPQNQPVIQEYQQAFIQNKELIQFDNLNLLYVAFTRAVDELYVLSATGQKQDNSRVQFYIANFIKEEQNVKEAGSYYLGEKMEASSQNKITPELEPPTYPRSNWRGKMKIVTNAPQYWQGGELSDGIARGRKMHALLARLEKATNLEQVLEEEEAIGNLRPGESERLKILLENVLHHPRLQHFYSDRVQVLNESEILVPGASAARPDRVVLEGQQAHIIDYKTGLEEDAHLRQLQGYRQLLDQMGYGQGQDLLVYIGEEIKIIPQLSQQSLF